MKVISVNGADAGHRKSYGGKSVEPQLYAGGAHIFRSVRYHIISAIPRASRIPFSNE